MFKHDDTHKIKESSRQLTIVAIQPPKEDKEYESGECTPASQLIIRQQTRQEELERSFRNRGTPTPPLGK